MEVRLDSVSESRIRGLCGLRLHVDEVSEGLVRVLGLALGLRLGLGLGLGLGLALGLVLGFGVGFEGFHKIQIFLTQPGTIRILVPV